MTVETSVRGTLALDILTFTYPSVEIGKQDKLKLYWLTL